MNTTLHIVSRLHGATLPESLQRSLGENDCLLLTGDGVYAAVSGQPLPARCLALEADVIARGLRPCWPAHIALTDHAGFVDLCVQYSKSLSWA